MITMTALEQADEDRRKRQELRDVREEITLRSRVLRAFPDSILGQTEADECAEQNARFLWLLARERKLMGEEWVTT